MKQRFILHPDAQNMSQKCEWFISRFLFFFLANFYGWHPYVMLSTAQFDKMSIRMDGYLHVINLFWRLLKLDLDVI